MDPGFFRRYLFVPLKLLDWIMEFLDEHQAERLWGGRRSHGGGRTPTPLAPWLRGVLGFGMPRGIAPLGGGGTAIDTTVNQINLAFNIVLNGGSIVNNQLNGLDLSVSA